MAVQKSSFPIPRWRQSDKRTNPGVDSRLMGTDIVKSLFPPPLSSTNLRHLSVMIMRINEMKVCVCPTLVFFYRSQLLYQVKEKKPD